MRVAQSSDGLQRLFYTLIEWNINIINSIKRITFKYLKSQLLLWMFSMQCCCEYIYNEKLLRNLWKELREIRQSHLII